MPFWFVFFLTAWWYTGWSCRQALEPARIDVRTDVYALGVILYQMWTGRFPYEVVGSMRDVLDRILKTELSLGKRAEAEPLIEELVRYDVGWLTRHEPYFADELGMRSRWHNLRFRQDSNKAMPGWRDIDRSGTGGAARDRQAGLARAQRTAIQLGPELTLHPRGRSRNAGRK